MLNDNVVVGYDADVSGYTSSLRDAIAITSQFGNVSSSVLGKIATAGSTSLSGLTKAAGALTGAFGAGSTQAANYQQALLGLQATAKASGQSFDSISDATKKMARDMPIGIGGAIEMTRALQQAGTSAKDIEKLAPAMAKLGAANGDMGSGLGTQFVQLQQSYGDMSTERITKMGDTLTTLSAKMGASASATTSFAQSIAPLAKAAGLGQTSVLGVSAAFARLGESGFASANAFNRILVDFNEAATTGAPVLTKYAEAVGMSAKSFETMVKTNPSQALTSVFDALSKDGPEAIRTLNNLGLEGVRTQRSLAAVSQSGGLGEVFKTARDAYGNGSTKQAADIAMGGVNNSLTRLGETSSQITAGVGAPMLKFVQPFLNALNTGAELINKFINNDIVQKMMALGTAVGKASSFLMVMATKRLLVDNKWIGTDLLGTQMLTRKRVGANSEFGAFNIKNFIGDNGKMLPGWVGENGKLSEKYQNALKAYTADLESMRISRTPKARARSMLEQLQKATTVDEAQNVLNKNLVGAGSGIGQFIGNRTDAKPWAMRGATWIDNAKRTSAAAFDYYNSFMTTSMMESAINPRDPKLSKRRQDGKNAANEMRDFWKEQKKIAEEAAGGALGWKEKAKLQWNQERDAFKARELARGWTTPESRVGRTFAEMTGSKVRFAGNLGRSVGSTIGTVGVSAATSLWGLAGAAMGPMAYAAPVAAIGYGIWKQNQIEKQSRMQAKDLSMDIFKVSNDYANSTGMASKGMVSLNSSVSGATDEFIRLTSSVKDAVKLNKNESRNATTPGYKAEFQFKTKGTDENASEKVAAMIIAKGGGDPMLTAKARMDAEASMKRMNWTENQITAMQDRLNEMVGDSKYGETGMKALKGLADSFTQSRDAQIFEIWKGNSDVSQERVDMFSNTLNQSLQKIIDTQGMSAARKALDKELLPGGSLYGKLSTDTSANRQLSDVVSEAANQIGFEGASQLKTYLGRQVSPDGKPGDVWTYEKISKEAFNLAQEKYGLDLTTMAGWEQFKEIAAQNSENKNIFGTVSGPYGSKISVETLNTPDGTKTYKNDSTPSEFNAGMFNDLKMSQIEGIVNSYREDQGMVNKTKEESSADAVRNKEIFKNLEAFPTAAKEMNEVAKLLSEFSVDELLKRDDLTDFQKAYLEFDKGGKTAQLGATIEAGMQLAKSFMKESGNNPIKAQKMFDQILFGTDASNPMRIMAEQGVGGVGAFTEAVSRRSVLNSPFQNAGDKVDLFKSAYQAVKNNDTTDNRELFGKRFQDATQSYTDTISMLRQLDTQARQMDVQKFRANEQFQIQMERSLKRYNISRSRAELQYQIQTRRAEFEHHRQIKWQNKDFYHQRDLQIKEFNIQQKFQEKQFYQQRKWTLEDYNKQLLRQAEDAAKQMLNPYQRLQQQMVQSGASILATMDEQAKQMQQQLSAVASLQGAGLSDAAVNVLDLLSPQKAKQAMSLAVEALSDPELVRKLNDSVKGRVDLSKIFVEESSQGKRGKEDLNKSLERNLKVYKQNLEQQKNSLKRSLEESEYQFKLALERNAKQFSLAMRNSKADFDRSMRQQAADFKLMNKEAQEDFNRSMRQMQEDFERQFDEMTRYAKMSTKELLNRVVEFGGKYGDKMVNQARKVIRGYKKMIDKEDLPGYLDKQMPSLPGNGSGGTAPNNNPNAPKVFQPALVGSGGVALPASFKSIKQFTGYRHHGPTKVDGKPADPRYLAASRDFSMDVGRPVYAVTNGQIATAIKYSSASKQANEDYWPGYIRLSGSNSDFIYGHLSRLFVNSGQRVKKGDVIGLSGDSGNYAHLHFEIRKKGGSYGSGNKNMDKWLSRNFADGGIATRSTRALIGEAGHAEAVIPLNDRGVKFLAQALKRYTSNDSIAMARTKPYTSTINNVTTNIDQSTKINGPISVQTSDPDDFRKQMAARQRRQALLNPVGSVR